MFTRKKILQLIKDKVKSADPNATIILYGSFARGENHPDSDIDLLILVNKDQLTLDEKKRIKYPLYEIEFETGRIISPLVIPRNDWETRHKITPFYDNLKKEGIVL